MTTTLHTVGNVAVDMHISWPQAICLIVMDFLQQVASL